MKRIVCSVAAVLCAFFASAEQYRIVDVKYDIIGRTREYALNKNLDIRKNVVFSSKEVFEMYLTHLKQVLVNQRVLQESEITYTTAEADENGTMPVTLLITAKDTWSILPLPYPKYNSNDGFSFKLKVKDFNFWGSMEPLDFEIVFSQENEGNDNVLSTGLSFAIPFSMGVFDAKWETDSSLSYTIGADRPEFNFSTGMSMAFPFKFVTLSLTLKQKINQDLDYKSTGDELYFTEYAGFDASFTLYRSSSLLDKIIWKPYTSVTYNWDTDGIFHPDLTGPVLAVGHTISAGSVNWYGNFRQGITGSVTQNFDYNFDSFSFIPSISAEVKGFYAFKYAGIASRLYAYTYYDVFDKKYTGTKNIGSRIRGVYDSKNYNEGQTETAAAVCLNLDIPVKILQTDWLGWGKALFKRDMPSFFRYFDFELQFAPFIDVALIRNTAKDSLLNPKDGFIGTGLEVVVYPTKMRSIQVRGSVGFDVSRQLSSASWRTSKGPEIEIGIGLHY